jgi:anaerobic ribonucleoside-triphosphate reductase activating protein
MKVNIAGFLPNSLVNGVGTRSVVFFSGCNHRCPGCHNEAFWEVDSGEEMELEEVFRMIDKNLPLINGVTLSGGDPFFQADKAAEIAAYAKSNGLSVWTYTGYTLEQLNSICKRTQAWAFRALLDNSDILVDGRFEEELHDDSLKYRGSTNQRILKLGRNENEYTGIEVNI